MKTFKPNKKNKKIKKIKFNQQKQKLHNNQDFIGNNNKIT